MLAGNNTHEAMNRNLLLLGALRFKRGIARQLRDNRTGRRLRNILPVSPAKGAILFFVPEAGVEAHLAAMCVLARTLKEQGQTVLMARCFQLYSRCPVMDMYALPYQPPEKTRRSVCLNCASSSFRLLDEYGLDVLDLRHFDSPQIGARIDQILRDLPADLREFEFEGHALGKMCAMDVVLATKTSDFEHISPAVRLAWVRYIEAALKSLLLVRAVLNQIDIEALAHFNDYSLLLGARLAAREKGVRCFSITQASHCNIDRSRYVLRSSLGGETSNQQGDLWPQVRELALSPRQIEEGGDDLMSRFGGVGSHMFSPAKSRDDVRQTLNLDPSLRLLVAYTSSPDEMMATRMNMEGLGVYREPGTQPFGDQIEWLRAVCDWVQNRPDLQLVVRIHPREGVKKRAGASQNLARLHAAFDQMPPRCHVVWPDEPISSYDLAESADLALFGWSTIGQELARLGVPTLAAFRRINPFPQDDFLEWAATPADYFAKAAAMLERATNVETLSRAWRWYSWYHLGHSLDFGDVVPDLEFTGLPLFRPSRQAPALLEVMAQGRDILDWNLERQRELQNADVNAAEIEALQTQLRRLIHFCFTGEDKTPARDDFSLQIHRQNVIFCDAKEQKERFSPLVARLAPLCGVEVKF